MSSSSPTVLYASYVSPFPTNSGERIRAVNLIAALRSLGYAVEAIVGNYDDATLSSHNSDGVRFRQIPFDWPRLRQATSVYFRAQRPFIDQVEVLHRVCPLSAVILDYGFLGAQIAPLAALGIPVVLGTHNVESALTGQLPSPSRIGSLPIRLRQAIEFTHERWFFPCADAVLCVSDEDKRAYAAFIPPDRLHLVPNFVDIPDRYRRITRTNRIIFAGSFSNFQNAEGLKWFLEQVWDAELQERTTLCVAGKLSDKAVEKFLGVPKVTGLGARDDLLIEIAQSRVAIVPLWQGGGTRFKCIEAMAVRTPVVSTSKGCEGIRHDNAFQIADDPRHFKASIINILDNADKADSDAETARAAFDRYYGLAANAQLLSNAITSARRFHEINHLPGLKNSQRQ